MKSVPKFTTRVLTVFLLLAATLTCSVVKKNTWGKYFQDAGVEGCFLFYDLRQNRSYGYNLERVEAAYIPASTFKIMNSLIALETEVIKDENETLPWDGIEHEVISWNQEHNLRSAMKHSAVWFYQELARRIGQDHMQQYIDAANYGNRNINGGIDHFWLDGELRITAKQQIDFLVRLYQNKLPFAQKNLDIVKDILILEKTDSSILRGKTGWARFGPEHTLQIGWFVGYVECGDRAYFFALNIDINEAKQSKARIAITRKILNEMNLLD